MKQYYLAHQLKYRYRVQKIQLHIEQLTGLKLINPFYDTGRTDMQAIDSGKKSRYSFSKDESIIIREHDLQWINNCDGIVCILIDSDTIGSYMEIFYCSRILQKPVYLICNIKKVSEHLWMNSLVWKQFNSVQGFISYIIDNKEMI